MLIPLAEVNRSMVDEVKSVVDVWDIIALNFLLQAQMVRFLDIKKLASKVV